MLRSRHLGLIATGSTDCVIAVRESCTQRILKMRVLEWLMTCPLRGTEVFEASNPVMPFGSQNRHRAV